MAEADLPDSWPAAGRLALGHSIWILPLVVAERLVEGHFYQALFAVIAWVVAVFIAVQLNVLQEFIASQQRRRRLLTWVLIVAGTLALGWGIARLATESREPNVNHAEVQNQLQAERDARTALDQQLAASRRELQEAQAQRDAARAQPPQAAAPDKAPAANQGPIDWNLNGQFIVGNGNEANAKIHSVLLQGRSRDSTTFKEAYAISGLTGRRQELMANANGYHPVSKVDVPAQALVQLDLVFNQGLSIGDFMEIWGKFRITIIHNDGTVFQHDFDESYVRQKVQQQFPSAFGPRVTPRE